MRKHKKISKEERDYWSQVAISCSQVTFGVFWALIILLPKVDAGKVFLIILNLAACLIFWFCGWMLKRRR